MTTKEIIDKFFEQKPDTTSFKIKGRIDRKELYDYEEQQGVDIFHMDTEQLFGLLRALGLNAVSYSSMASLMRNLFTFYSEEVEPIINPWLRKDMRGGVVAERFANADDKKISIESYNDALRMIRTEFGDYRVDYLTMILRLFFEGFETSAEIIDVKQEDIDFDALTINVHCENGRTKLIHISQRTLDLLTQYKYGDEYAGDWKRTFRVDFFEDSVFPFLIEGKSMNERGRLNAIRYIAHQFIRNVKPHLENEFNLRQVYLLGMYQSVVRKFGKEKAIELLQDRNTEENNAKLVAAIREFGWAEESANVYKIRHMIRLNVKL